VDKPIWIGPGADLQRDACLTSCNSLEVWSEPANREANWDPVSPVARIRSCSCIAGPPAGRPRLCLEPAPLQVSIRVVRWSPCQIQAGPSLHPCQIQAGPLSYMGDPCTCMHAYAHTCIKWAGSIPCCFLLLLSLVVISACNQHSRHMACIKWAGPHPHPLLLPFFFFYRWF
jgi:hypothetical protein